MCFHFANFVEAQGLEDRFKAKFPSGSKFDPAFHINGFNKPIMPVITNDEPESLNLYRWGMIPFWVKDEKSAEDISSKTLNAREETIFEKPSFKNSIKSKRCLIPSTGFFEWMHYKGNAYPHFIFLRDEKIFSFAGIWSDWTNKSTGEIMHTFSIITTEANPLMAKIHNKKKRMPVILKKNDETKWLDNDLDEESIRNLLVPFDENKMNAYTISKLITDRSRNSNVKEVIDKYEYNELN